MRHLGEPGPNGQSASGMVSLRESHPVRAVAVLYGAAAAAVWLVAFGLLAVTVRGYLAWILLAGSLAWLAAYALARAGDRGVAVGIAAATGVAWSVAVINVAVGWTRLGVWPV